MSLFNRLFSEDAALEPKRKPLNIAKKFELGGSKPTPGPLEPSPVTPSMTKGASARPVATGKLGHIFGAKPSNRISKRFSEDLRARLRRLFTELDANPTAPVNPAKPAQPVQPIKLNVKSMAKSPVPAPEAEKPQDAKPTTDVPKPSTGPYKLGSQNAKAISQVNSYSETLDFIDSVIAEAKKRGFVSQEISHLMHGKASKGPLKGKHVPQKQAVAIALNVARRKGIKS